MSKPSRKFDKDYWRSLDQRHDTKAYRKFLHDRHQSDHPEGINSLSRRSFMSLMGASLAMAGLAGCRRPVEKIVPYVSQPEEVTIGVPQKYATTMPLSLSSYGLLVECCEGRPIKIDGNPSHPSTQGASDAFMQASILGLYDPDRSKEVRKSGQKSTYEDFVTFWTEHSAQLANTKGQDLALLSEPFSSPSLARLKKQIMATYPDAAWYAYEPIGDENSLTAVATVTGQALRMQYHYKHADVILSLDCDFMQYESEAVAAASGFAQGRKVETTDDRMNRLYVVESNFSVTGGMADHRLRLGSEEIGHFALALAQELGIEDARRTEHSFNVKWLKAVADDLRSTQARCLIVVGQRQPVWVHKLVMHLNAALNNFGPTISFASLEDAVVSDRAGLAELTERLNNGEIKTLVMLGGNPAYSAPSDSNFADAISTADVSVSLGEYRDETSRLATWHIPRAHYLESWGDCRAVDGTPSVIQPLIQPLFSGKTDLEVYGLLAGIEEPSGYDLVRETWQSLLKGDDFEKQWRQVLHDGLLEFKRPFAISPTFGGSVEQIAAEASAPLSRSAQSLEVGFYPSRLYDGRFANNGWLMEMPDATTRLSWDNTAEISPATAQELNLKTGDVVTLNIASASLDVPVFVCPGYADYFVALPLGFGRENLGRVADGVGFDAYKLRSSDSFYFAGGATLTPTGQSVELANTQDHGSMEGRPIVREATLDEFKANPEFAAAMVEHPPLKSIYPDHDYSQGYQWGMVIDLNACNGCNACVVACQSENNVPIVGKEQVARGREMHWIRNDRYFVGDDENPRMVHQPVACQQCENAPCEQVCPVAATVHDKEGLNTMNYNRCIGTRYCSNNCPYKVRRFNFFNYTNELPEVVQMAQNPDVTVRSRGVMEKCTFCTQRINRVKGGAKRDGRTVADGEIVTACEQACPTKAIRFGNVNDPNSEVSRLKKDSRNYALLGEFNVRPRTTYLARLRNPNPVLAVANPEGIEEH